MAPGFPCWPTRPVSRPEQALLSLCAVLRRNEAEVGPRRGGRDPAPRGPGEQPFPYEERLGDLLDRLALLPHGHREGGEPDGAPAEELEQGAEHRPVQPVESPGVDLVHPQGGGGDVPVDPPLGLDLGVVADTAQQAVGDAGVPRERPAISAAPAVSMATSSSPAERWMTRSSSVGA